MDRREAARRAHERRRAADELLEHEIDAELVPVWRAIGARARAAFKPGAHCTRAESFASWCHDHGADVQRISINAQEAGVDALWSAHLSGETSGDVAHEPIALDVEPSLAHLPANVAARLAARAPGSCLAKWGRKPAHRKECPGCRPALEIPF
jgi:hypothetical protein